VGQPGVQRRIVDAVAGTLDSQGRRR
jgi:hypothetical protein